MSMMRNGLAFDANADSSSIAEMIATRVAAGAKSLLVLVGEDVPLAVAGFDGLLRSQGLPLFGGIFPCVVYGGTASSRAAVVVGLDCAVHVAVVDKLSLATLSADRVRAAWGEGAKPATVVIWADGTGSGLSALVESVFDVFGAGPSYIGGGAGSLSLKPGGCLFCNEGILADAALLVGFPKRMGVGSEHGWEGLAGPFLVTGAHANVIDSLDYLPALDVYRNVVDQFSPIAVDPANLGSVARAFPFGLERMDGSLMVRDPVLALGGHLVCMGDVPQQSSIHVLRGDPQALVSAVRQGSMQACSQVAERASGALFVSCMSRALFLKERFADELATVHAVLDEWGHVDVPVFGVLSLGEIANPGDHCLEFLNKTFALGLLP